MSEIKFKGFLQGNASLVCAKKSKMLKFVVLETFSKRNNYGAWVKSGQKFWNCVLFDTAQTPEFLKDSGVRLEVSGRLACSWYTGKDGKNETSEEVIVSSVEPALSASDQGKFVMPPLKRDDSVSPKPPRFASAPF